MGGNISKQTKALLILLICILLFGMIIVIMHLLATYYPLYSMIVAIGSLTIALLHCIYKTILEYLSALFEAIQPIKTLGAVRGVLNDLRVTVLNTVPISGTLTGVTTVKNLGCIW